MRSLIIIPLACFLIIPFMAISQNNEEVKTRAKVRVTGNLPEFQRSSQDLSLLQGETTSGGAAMASGVTAENSPLFLEPGWANGRILLKDKTSINNLLLRYDIYNQQIQFVKDDDTLAFANPDEVSCFVFDDRRFIYSEYLNNSVIGKGYFEIIADGKCRLLLRRSIKYHLAPEHVNNLREDIYMRENEYFIAKNGDMARPVKLCRKSVLCALNDKEEEVKKYMRDHKFKMNDCEQLGKVVDFYNTLIE